MNAPREAWWTQSAPVAEPMPQGRTIAYVMNGFPRLSETFITHEIHQLEQIGLRLRLFSVKRENEDKVHPVVSAIRAPLEYLPRFGSLSGARLVRWLSENRQAYAGPNLKLMRARPWAYLRTAALALGLAWRHRSTEPGQGTRLRKVFIKEFLQAALIAQRVREVGDVGHLHGHFCHGVATITWFVSRLTGIPFSFTAHAKDIYQADLNPGRLLERKLEAARFVVTCTLANAQVLRARHPRPEDVHAIYHGLDTRFFRPEGPVAGDDDPLILSVGRFVAKKGFEHLIEACARLHREGVRFRCLIVGEPGDASESIRQRIAHHGLQALVSLRGAVAQDELREIYRQARVFALPCQVMADGDRDGFPNVLAEAMAMGVPVVSTAISGIPEMIDDSVHGLLVGSGDDQALAEALRRVIEDPSLQGRLAREGRRRIRERFDSRRTTLSLAALFGEQLDARQRRTA